MHAVQIPAQLQYYSCLFFTCPRGLYVTWKEFLESERRNCFPSLTQKAKNQVVIQGGGEERGAHCPLGLGLVAPQTVREMTEPSGLEGTLFWRAIKAPVESILKSS